MNNKATIDELINEMIQVLITEVDITINKSNLVFKHKTDRMTGSLIAKSIGKYGLEWSSDIIRDQVYATLYESMLTASKDKNVEELRLDNPAFMGPVYTLTELKLREELIPTSKKNRNGEIIGFTEEFFSPVAEDNQTISLEQLLNGSVSAFKDEEKKANHFINWFNANKKTVLTKKQLQFINGELDYIDKANVVHIRKRIADRVISAYTAKYGSVSSRVAALMDQQEAIETILEAKDFRAALLPHINKDYIIDTIIDNVSPEASRAFNAGSNEVRVIREYRIALFKKIDDINNALTKNFIIYSKNHNLVA